MFLNRARSCDHLSNGINVDVMNNKFRLKLYVLFCSFDIFELFRNAPPVLSLCSPCDLPVLPFVLALCSLCALSLLSMCSLCAIYVLSLCSPCDSVCALSVCVLTVGPQSSSCALRGVPIALVLCTHCALAVLSLCHPGALSVLSLWCHCVISVLSLYSRCALTVLSWCYLSVPS